ncbi:class II aldolase/adducin family protein [Rhodococcus hoagii]|nr:class II aldolase/adducin family protein [Prescottella equi]NKZ87324.1 class II aldolase/adducin family protein [Prescottella equi]
MPGGDGHARPHPLERGYRDHLAGHITYNLGDGTLLCNPWLLTWEEVCPDDLLRIDLQGNLIEGDWPVPLGIPLHLALHNARPKWCGRCTTTPSTARLWGDIKEVPPAYDQSSSLGAARWFSSTSTTAPSTAWRQPRRRSARSVTPTGRLLGGHGVFVIADTARRSSSARWRSNSAARTRGWSVSPRTGQDVAAGLWLDRQLKNDGNGFHGFWEAAVRKEMRADPVLAQKILSRPR